MKSIIFSLLILCSSIATATNNVLIIGDSLSASYGVEENKSWSALIKENLHKEYPGYYLINASISGETSNGGLSRLPELLKKYQPRILIIELGANDGLQGLPIQVIENNLSQMIRLGKKSGSQILLVGIRIPENLGPTYTQRFTAIYPKLAEQEKVLLLPNLLEGIDENPELFQEDALHPNQQAQSSISANIWDKLSILLKIH
ncbi:arylesterase [Legionella sp.]|uniref:arylesterase n=1 Tax=Legionella sp. TaxID=459 RepID=UPI003D14E1E9